MIKAGDLVNVFWEHCNAEFKAKVLFVPAEHCYIWGLEREDGTILYIQNFCKMVRIS